MTENAKNSSEVARLARFICIFESFAHSGANVSDQDSKSNERTTNKSYFQQGALCFSSLNDPEYILQNKYSMRKGYEFFKSAVHLEGDVCSLIVGQFLTPKTTQKTRSNCLTAHGKSVLFCPPV